MRSSLLNPQMLPLLPRLSRKTKKGKKTGTRRRKLQTTKNGHKTCDQIVLKAQIWSDISIIILLILLLPILLLPLITFVAGRRMNEREQELEMVAMAEGPGGDWELVNTIIGAILRWKCGFFGSAWRKLTKNILNFWCCNHTTYSSYGTIELLFGFPFFPDLFGCFCFLFVFFGLFFSPLTLPLCVCVKGARLWNNVVFIWSHNLRNVCSPIFIIFFWRSS